MADASARPGNAVKSTQTPRAAGPAGPSAYAGLPTGRVLGVRRCPHCDLQTAEPVAVCPECGEALHNKPKPIRCRQCGRRALSSLALCPHCGRELRAAPPRLLTWGAPAVVVLLFLAVLIVGWDGGNPVSQVASSLRAGFALVGGAGEQTGSGTILVMTPVSGEAAAQAAADAQVPAEAGATESPDAEQAASAPAATEPPKPEPSATPSPALATASPAATTAPAATGPPATVTPASPAAEASPTAPVTATASPLGALLPSATPVEAEATATTSAVPAPPLGSRGGLVAAIVSAAQPTAAAPTATPTPTAVPTATATPTATPVTYQIRPGDTLVAIAGRFAVSVDDLMAANDLSAADVYTIQPGQALIIPAPAGTDQALPTSTAAAIAAAAVTATVTVTPAATPAPDATATAGWRVAAPVLRSPEDGAQVSCGASDSLMWLPVAQVGPTDLYVMHLGYVDGHAADGREQVVWILEEPRPANATSWEMDGDTLCGLAPQEFGRQWRWYVQVVAQSGGRLTPISPPSDTWGFAWN